MTPASVYADKAIVPDDAMLTHDLADTRKYYDMISECIRKEYGNYSSEWKFYNRKSGWIQKMYTKKRNVLFIIPCEACFRVVFTLGDKAAGHVFTSELPDSIKNELHQAKKYMEGRTIQVEVKTEEDLSNVLQIIKIKLL
ncbi:DUF3788 family protein, partial [Balneolaceae bacterium ANBcel3]|nr:DUF3788 family protein [Balneolaceae bacterium ANBcel3]